MEINILALTLVLKAMERGREKVEKFSTISWESAVQQLKKGWLLEFLALEAPALLMKEVPSMRQHLCSELPSMKQVL